MAKWLGIAVVLGAAVGAAWWLSGPGSQAGQTCRKMEALCGADVLPADACMDALRDAPQPEVDTLTQCAEASDSCLEATGCLAGSAARELATGALRGVLGG